MYPWAWGLYWLLSRPQQEETGGLLSLCVLLLVWVRMCVYACDNWYISYRSVRKITPGATVNEEIWDDVDKYCCVDFHMKFGMQFAQIGSAARLSLYQIKWLCWIPLYCRGMLYGNGFDETDDVDWWFLRSSYSSCVLFRVPGCPCLQFFIVFPKSLWAYRFSGGGLWSSGDIPGFAIDTWILGYNGCCVLVAGKLCPQQRLSCVCLSCVFLFLVCVSFLCVSLSCLCVVFYSNKRMHF